MTVSDIVISPESLQNAMSIPHIPDYQFKMYPSFLLFHAIYDNIHVDMVRRNT